MKLANYLEGVDTVYSVVIVNGGVKLVQRAA